MQVGHQLFNNAKLAGSKFSTGPVRPVIKAHVRKRRRPMPRRTRARSSSVCLAIARPPAHDGRTDGILFTTAREERRGFHIRHPHNKTRGRECSQRGDVVSKLSNGGCVNWRATSMVGLKGVAYVPRAQGFPSFSIIFAAAAMFNPPPLPSSSPDPSRLRLQCFPRTTPTPPTGISD